MKPSVSPIVAQDQVAIEKVVAVAEAVRLHETPAMPPMTAERIRLTIQHPFSGRRNEHYLAEIDSEPVGRLFLNFPTLDNLDNMHLQCEVVPSARRRGIGGQLLELAKERARAGSRKRLITDTSWSLPGLPAADDAGVVFAEKNGFSSALPEVQRRLDLSTVSVPTLDEMLRRAEASSAGYRLVQWRDEVPEEYVHDVAYLDSRLLEDAPMGDLQWEPEKVDAQRHRQAEQTHLARGHRSWHTGAVHVETGRMVAWTLLSVEHVDWHAWQGITIVEPEHRGHRLGALVKVANLRWFQQEQPAVRAVDTFNAAENSYMIAINEQMGFRPLYAFQNWQREL